MKNKCEDLGIAHAWRSSQEVYGFSVLQKETCANCDLSRTHCYEVKEWYSYSDGRPNEEIHNDIRPNTLQG